MSKLAGKMSKAWRQAQRIFHFLVGIAFMFLAAIGISISLDAWRYYVTHPSAGLLRFYVFSGFTAFLIFFSLFSFLKARSIR